MGQGFGLGIGIGVAVKKLVNYVESLFNAWTDHTGQEYEDHEGNTYELLATDE